MSDATPDSEATGPLGLDQADVRELRSTGLLGIAWAVLPGVLGITLLYQLGPVSEWLDARPELGLFLYLVAFSITAGLGLLPTYAQATLGGWVYGFGVGFSGALVGFTVASAIGYGVARRVSGDHVRHVLARHPQAKIIERELVGRGGLRALLVVTLLRVPPNSPFSLTNLAFAAVRVPLPIYLVGTLVGMAPRTAVYVGFAAAAKAAGAQDIQSFVSDGPGWWVFVGGIVLMVAVFAILGHMANLALAKYGGETQPGPGDVAP
ncbi:TVP38/TMEM64 family protein [Engelhardtia mirabilis]|uniref:TVP38/TMEM64 family membrane protein n=1 Tax=Engelhardtia mirabilis TaxID=2528011 RepID=A0A518BHI7_9BACT|nr:SNARE associated Golgi protein [Planctomycetes bacterium Pla133]QDV00776.1 SNARE associated Golgi protein [Planctomycetes bacterium Pla86]